MKRIKFVGLDVHADTIAVAVRRKREKPDSWGSSRSCGADPQTGQEAGAAGATAVLFEAGPTGYALYWQLTQWERSAKSWRRHWYR